MSPSDWLFQPQNALSCLAALAPQSSALSGLAALTPTRSILDGLGVPPIPGALSGLGALGSFGFGGSALPQVSPALPAAPSPLRWIHVRRRFNALLEAIAITPDQANDGMTKLAEPRPA